MIVQPFHSVGPLVYLSRMAQSCPIGKLEPLGTFVGSVHVESKSYHSMLSFLCNMEKEEESFELLTWFTWLR